MGLTGAFFPRLRGLNLHDLPKDGKIDELKSAIADKCDPNIIHPKTGTTPLQYAADANQVSVIKELLANAAEIDFTGVSQVTALYSTFMKSNVDASAALLEGGSDPNKALGNGSTPLMAAIKKGSVPLVDLLLKYGAKPILDNLMTAFEKKDKVLVNKMKNALENAGIWSPYLQGESMFHQFCRKGYVAIVSLALEFGADSARANGEGQSPLDIATSAGRDKVCDTLIKVGKSYLRNWLGKGLKGGVKVI
jgi:ankyrin repeat protein